MLTLSTNHARDASHAPPVSPERMERHEGLQGGARPLEAPIDCRPPTTRFISPSKPTNYGLGGGLAISLNTLGSDDGALGPTRQDPRRVRRSRRRPKEGLTSDELQEGAHHPSYRCRRYQELEGVALLLSLASHFQHSVSTLVGFVTYNLHLLP